jgi:hypothetical protein
MNQNWENYGSSKSLATQKIYAGLIPLLNGDTITNIHVFIVTAGSGTAPTAINVGLFNSSGTLLQGSGDVKTSFNSGTGFKTLALSATYGITVDGGYYIGVWQNGAFGVTQPAVLANSVGTAAQGSSAPGSGIPAYADATGLVSFGTFTPGALSGNQVCWFGVS